MATLLKFMFRLTLLAAGLVLAIGVSTVFVLGFAAWGTRALWARLRGRSAPARVRMHRGTRRAPAADVINVEARPVQHR